MDEQYKLVVNMLPDRIKNILLSLNHKVTAEVTEIRLRCQKPLALTLNNSTVYPYYNTYSLSPNALSCIIKSEEMYETFRAICNNSIYSHEQELSEGYVTLTGGHRAGVCGRIIVRQNKSRWITDISSINIRISREVIGYSKSAMGKIMNANGIIICGPPHSGKTTFLRDFVCNLSNRGERVAVIDCRGEIAAVNNGVCGLNVGNNTDVITGGTKSEGIERALRTMTPDIIAFDEIGSINELNGIVDCMNSGVKIVTSLHAASVEELLRRNRYLPLLEIGAFTHIVFLDIDHNVKIIEVGDINAEGVGVNSNNRLVYGIGVT